MNDIITNKPAQAPKVELFSENDISIRYRFPDGYDMSNLSAKIYRKLDNVIISDVSKQPTTTLIDDVFYITFSSAKLKSLSAPFVLYVYDGDSAIIGQDCVTSNKTGVYNDIITQVVIGDETNIEVNAQLNPASTWGSIQGDITQQEDLIEYLTANGLSKEEADGFYYSISNPSNFISSINSGNVITALGYTPYNASNPNGYISGITSLQVTNALGFTPVSTTGSYTDPSWLTISKSKVGLSNVLNVAQEPSITGGTSGQYWNGLKQWVNFPTIPTNNNQLTNGANFITASSTDTLTNKSGNISQWTNNSGYLTGITSTQINTALGYTPYNSTNPNGYISGINSGDVTTALGYTPYNGAANPNGYITNANVYSKTEVDNFFSGTTAKTGYNKANWDNSFSWGNHAIAGYTTASNTQTFTNKSGNISQWTNDVSYLTSITGAQVNTALGYTPVNPNGTNLQYIAGDGSKITFPTIPTNTNQLTNGAGYITASSTNTLTNKSISGTTNTFSGIPYSALTGTPTIPTLTSQLTNDSGYITASSTNTLTNKSISYDQLTGTPTIPTNANYVDLTTNQTGIAGNKSTTGSWTFGASMTSQNIIPSTSNTYTSGSSSNGWSAVYGTTFWGTNFLNTAAATFGSSNTTSNILIRQGTGGQLIAGFQSSTGNAWFQSPSSAPSDSLAGITVNHLRTASSAIARGFYLTSTLTASANNDVLVGIDLSPTFTNGAFIGVTNLALRTNNDIENTKTNGAIILKDTATLTRQFIRVTNGVISIATS